MKETIGVTHSIIIPMYNAESTIEKCVISVLGQTVENIEIILVDDGSTDNTFSICLNLQKKDERIRVYHKTNGGVSSARNMGLDKAEGKYIYFIDSDDFVDKQYIEHLNTSDAEIIVGAYIIEDYEGKKQVIKSYPKVSFEIMNYALLKKYIIMGMFNYSVAKRFLRSVIVENTLRFDPLLRVAEDTDFVISYLRYIQSVEINSATDYHYIKGVAGTTLSTQVLSKHQIDNIENANDHIYNNLLYLFESDARAICTKRMMKVYEGFVAKILSKEPIDRSLLEHIFRKKWFRYVLGDPEVFKDENFKFRLIMRLKSHRLLLFYLKYIQHRKLKVARIKESKNAED